MQFPLTRLYRDEQAALLDSLLTLMFDDAGGTEDALRVISEHLSMDQVDELVARLP